MKITVKLFANLRINNKKEEEMVLEKESTAMDIIKRLNISEKDASIIMINGRRKNLNTKLYQGDIVSIFPPVGGG